MKILIFVVRVFGIVLLFRGVATIVDAAGLSGDSASLFGMSIGGLIPEGAVTRLYVVSSIEVALGLICVLFAGRVVRCLTFDAPGE